MSVPEHESMFRGMPIEAYLADGGLLTNPANVPSRYRGELMRLMASFVDSEIAGAAGFADTINRGPGIKERIAASRIVAEKLEHGERVLRVMAEFGMDIDRYVTHHPWTDRLPRDSDIGAARHGSDMRLNVFHYPLQGWADAVTTNVLMGTAVVIQIEELARVSYQPLADAFRFIRPREARHAEMGVEGLRRLLEDPAERRAVDAALAYWMPRVTASFGAAGSARFATQRRFGLRHTPNEELQARWVRSIDARLGEVGLRRPRPDGGRR
jgi:ring-1,2-phenylacetyl-CoA epoxidase subunit PaaA